MIITAAKLLKSSVIESLLIIQNKLFSVIFR